MIYLNNRPMDVTIFNDRTSQVWKLLESDIKDRNFAYIRWEFSQEGEFLHLAQLKALLDLHKIKAYLYIEYLPYARQDKRVSNDMTFALRPFATLLNSLKFKDIVIQDPHSSVATDLIKNSRAEYPVDKVETIVIQEKINLLCYPDKGAVNKYTQVYNHLRLPTIYGEKVRDQATGNITSYEIKGNPIGKNVLIIDDIIDGGMTFKLLAKDLFAEGAKSVVLFVTHGIFSKGLKPLREVGIQRIYTQRGEASEIQGHIAYKEFQ